MARPNLSQGHPPRWSAAGPSERVLELLRPGSFVKLRNQPADLPPFQLIQCRGGRCWVRQQAWGPLVQWEVAHTHLTTAA
ncbi:MAG: hypothetical protein ACKO7Z_10920 [Cyanobacteriota bacterium]